MRPAQAGPLLLAAAAWWATGCSTVAGTDPPDLDAIAQDAGCQSPTLLDTPPPGVLQRYDCAEGGTLLLFEDATARQDYLDVAAEDPMSWVAGEEWAYQAPRGAE